MSQENNSKNSSNTYHRAKQWEIALFSMNNAASNLYIFAFGFLTYYATGVAGFATLLISNVLGAARLFDGIIDPAIGVVMDRFNSRWGKYRPIMFTANIGLMLSFFMIFNVHRFEGGLQVFLFFISLIFHKIVYSFQQTVTKAAQPALTNDPKQRPLFSVYDTIFSSIGIFAIFQVIVSNVLSPRHGGEFDLGFFGEFLPLVMGISFILTLLAMFGIRRKDTTEYFGLGEETVETKSFSDYWSVLKGNKPLQILAIAGGIIKFVTSLIGDQAFMVILFGIILGNYGIAGRMAMVQIIPNLIIVLGFTRLASNNDLKSVYKYSIFGAIASVLLMVVIFFMTGDPTQIFIQGGITAVLVVIGYIGMKTFATYPTSIVLTMAADISDYETARSGRYVSGLIGTVFSLTDSIASSLAPIALGLIVASFGYTDSYPQPTESLTPDIYSAGILILGIVLVGLIIVGFLIHKYPLDQEAMEKVQRTIAERKAKGEIEEEPEAEVDVEGEPVVHEG